MSKRSVTNYRRMIDEYLIPVINEMELLGGDGQTVIDIVNALINMGVKGKMRNSCECPIAHYLMRKFPGVKFDVYHKYIEITDDRGYKITVDTLPCVEDFVRDFDCGMWQQVNEDVHPVPTRKHVTL